MAFAFTLTSILCALLCGSHAFSPVDVKVTFEGGDSPDFKVYLSGVEWLRSGAVGIRDSGQLWSTDNKDKQLLKVVSSSTSSGTDVLGEYDSTVFIWQAYSDANTPVKVKVETCISVYRSEPIVFFSIIYTDGLTNASIPNDTDQTLSSFPSFVVEETDKKRGYATWEGGQIGGIKIDKWSGDTSVYGSYSGGFPLVVFDDAMDTALVLSPASTFMSATQTSFKNNMTGENTLTFGPMSSIEQIPAGYKYSTILVASNNVTGAMRKFGEVMKTLYQKTSYYRKTDFTLNYLGYWTDNGGCYHYSHGSQFSNYEDLLVAVKKDADEKNLPYKYLQLDSWWYFKGPHDGCKNWTAMPSVFPDGIEGVFNKTGWRIMAHNRWWSHDTDYQKKFKFIVEEDIALPVDPTFWDYLMSSSQTEWGLMVYEQDWLLTQSGRTMALKTQLDLGELWLKQMGQSAQRYGITIQYCMPWTRHIMQTLDIPAVTQTRVSGDYHPDDTQWRIGDSSILAHTVGLAPFKDNFRTTSDQPDCAKLKNMTEMYSLLEAYVSVLSTGPVGPSDQVGKSNATLIMATCMMDGRLLQPCRPALSLDSTFVQRAFGSGGPDGYVTAAFTEIDGFTWYFILAAELSSSYSLSAMELPPSQYTFPASSFPQSTAFQYSIDGKVSKMSDFGSSTPLNIDQCGKSDFQYWVIAPYFPNGFALLGELNKITPVSAARFSDITVTDSDVTMKVNGVPKESVPVTLYDMKNKKSMVVTCTIGDAGTNKFSLASGTCNGI